MFEVNTEMCCQLPRTCPELLLNVLCTFNLRSVSRGKVIRFSFPLKFFWWIFDLKLYGKSDKFHWFVRKIINNPLFLLVKIPSFQEFKVLLLRLRLELLKRKTLPKSYHIVISTMIRPLRVLKAEAYLGLLQHPRWSTLW